MDRELKKEHRKKKRVKSKCTDRNKITSPVATSNRIEQIY